MLAFHPFRALTYGPRLRGKLDNLVHPAQSCEVPARGESLDELPTHHIGRLVRGDNVALGAEEANPYASTAMLLQDWKQTGVLTRDPRSSVYVYRQVLPQDTERERWGLVGSVEAVGASEGGLASHERTQGERPDLMLRLRTTETQLSLAWGLLRDEDGQISAWMRDMAELDRPMLHVMDGRGVLNTVWRVEDPEDLAQIHKLLNAQSAVLADGHHRYDCARRLREEKRSGLKRGKGRVLGSDRIATWLTPVGELPARAAAHPLALKEGDEASQETLESDLGSWFHREELPSRAALEEVLAQPAGGATRLGLMEGEQAFLLTLSEDRRTWFETMTKERPQTLVAIEGWRARVVLDALLGGNGEDERMDGRGRLAPIKPGGQSVAGASADDHEIVFLAPGLTAQQVWEVGDAGLLLPPKSTWFAPKPPKGLLMASLKGM